MLAGIFSGGALSAFAVQIIGVLFKGLLDGIFSAADKRRQDAAHEELGAARTAAAVNKETADAQRRAAEAATNAPDLGGMLDDMHGGVF